MSTRVPPPAEGSPLPWSRVALAALAGWPGIALLRFTRSDSHVLPRRETLEVVLHYLNLFGTASLWAGLPILLLALLSRTRRAWAWPAGMAGSMRAGMGATAVVWGFFTILCIARAAAGVLAYSWLAMGLGLVAPLLVLIAAGLGYALGK